MGIFKSRMEDWQSDNPAGRLHALLTALNERPDGESLRRAWAVVLSVEEADVQLPLAEIRKLAGAVQAAAVQPGRRAQAAHVNRYHAQWENAIFPLDQAFSAGVGNVKPAEVALEALASVAEYLHELAPEGEVPDDDRLSDLVSGLQELINEVKDSDELPPVIKQVIAARLAGVRQAIDHIAIGGPDAVRLATEAVAGAITVRDTSAWRSNIGHKIATGLSVIWFAFGFPAAVQDALPAWGNVIRGEIMPPAAQIATPHQVEPPALPDIEVNDHE